MKQPKYKYRLLSIEGFLLSNASRMHDLIDRIAHDSRPVPVCLLLVTADILLFFLKLSVYSYSTCILILYLYTPIFFVLKSEDGGFRLLLLHEKTCFAFVHMHTVKERRGHDKMHFEKPRGKRQRLLGPPTCMFGAFHQYFVYFFFKESFDAFTGPVPRGCFRCVCCCFGR